jgi:hypothetical protein
VTKTSDLGHLDHGVDEHGHEQHLPRPSPPARGHVPSERANPCRLYGSYVRSRRLTSPGPAEQPMEHDGPRIVEVGAHLLHQLDQLALGE